MVMIIVVVFNPIDWLIEWLIVDWLIVPHMATPVKKRGNANTAFLKIRLQGPAKEQNVEVLKRILKS